MKKWISVLLAAALMALLCACACADDDGSLRHEVTGDVSFFSVSEEKDHAKLNPSRTQGQLGTDVYLFVDPDTASYVTFYVTDEKGNPIKGAQIYLSYDDEEEFFGVTDKNGKLSTYLFRHVEYGYRVVHSGFETATGVFTAGDETDTVHVVLRRLYDLTICVVDGDKPLAGVTVIIDGYRYVTNIVGKITVLKTNGEYNVTVIAPDGRHIPVQAVVKGHTTIVVDVGKDDALMTDGVYNDRFLVYNKLYRPEDYELTYYRFTADDLTRLEGESDEEFAERTHRYLDARCNTLLIEAQPERKLTRSGETDLCDASGNPVYAQRSLMPTGQLIMAWEAMGYTDLVFTNEDFGVRLDMQALHTGDMAKLYALLSAKEYRLSARSIAKEGYENASSVTAMQRLSATGITVDKVDFSVIDDFEFIFDHNRRCNDDEYAVLHRLIDDQFFAHTLFEVRITPIQPQVLRDMVRDGIHGERAISMDTIMLASRGYYLEELRRWRADGKLTQSECSELFAYVIDGMLTKQELTDLRDKSRKGVLPADVVTDLLTSAVEEKAYRVSCYLILGDVKINITELLDGMISLWKVDDLYDDELAAHGAMDGEAAKDALEAKYSLLTVDNLGRSHTDKKYVAGENTAVLDLSLVCSLPGDQDEFDPLLRERWFDALTVDVYHERVDLGITTEPWYRADITADMTQLLERRALAAPNQTSGIAALVFSR